MNPYLADVLISFAVTFVLFFVLLVAACKLGPRVLAAAMKKSMSPKAKAPVAR